MFGPSGPPALQMKIKSRSDRLIVYAKKPNVIVRALIGLATYVVILTFTIKWMRQTVEHLDHNLLGPRGFVVFAIAYLAFALFLGYELARSVRSALNRYEIHIDLEWRRLILRHSLPWSVARERVIEAPAAGVELRAFTKDREKGLELWVCSADGKEYYIARGREIDPIRPLAGEVAAALRASVTETDRKQ
jgi:hypothetical protein